MKKLIGRIDKVDFPEFNLMDIDVKIDSGAYTSSIHCSDIIEIQENRVNYIQFTLLDPEHPAYNNKIFKTQNFSTKLVKSSNGISENRYVIKTEIRLFNQTFPIYLTLTQRGGMKYPVLIGRKFMNDKFIIDTTQKNLSYKEKRKVS